MNCWDIPSQDRQRIVRVSGELTWVQAPWPDEEPCVHGRHWSSRCTNFVQSGKHLGSWGTTGDDSGICHLCTVDWQDDWHDGDQDAPVYYCREHGGACLSADERDPTTVAQKQQQWHDDFQQEELRLAMRRGEDSRRQTEADAYLSQQWTPRRPVYTVPTVRYRPVRDWRPTTDAERLMWASERELAEVAAELEVARHFQTFGEGPRPGQVPCSHRGLPGPLSHCRGWVLRSTVESGWAAGVPSLCEQCQPKAQHEGGVTADNTYQDLKVKRCVQRGGGCCAPKPAPPPEPTGWGKRTSAVTGWGPSKPVASSEPTGWGKRTPVIQADVAAAAS